MIGNFAVLGHRQQDLIDRWLLAGKSVRWVASQTDPPVSFGAIQRYRKKLLGPALKRVAAKLPGVANIPVRTNAAGQVEQPLHAVTGESLADERVTPFMGRLEWLWQQASEALQDARWAMRVHTDKDGKVVFDGRDFAAITATLNQAHRNVELLGKATGAFTEQPNVDSPIVSPVCVNVTITAEQMDQASQRTYIVSPEGYEAEKHTGTEIGLADIAQVDSKETPRRL